MPRGCVATCLTARLHHTDTGCLKIVVCQKMSKMSPLGSISDEHNTSASHNIKSMRTQNYIGDYWGSSGFSSFLLLSHSIPRPR